MWMSALATILACQGVVCFERAVGSGQSYSSRSMRKSRTIAVRPLLRICILTEQLRHEQSILMLSLLVALLFFERVGRSSRRGCCQR